MRPYAEVRTGRSNDLEVLLGTILGAAAAAGAVWFVTVLLFSLN